MSHSTTYNKLYNNWNSYLDSLVVESPVYKYSGDVASAKDPLLRWDPKSVKATPIGLEPKRFVDDSWVKAKENDLRKFLLPVIATGIFKGMQMATGLHWLGKAKDWVMGIGRKIFGKGKAGGRAAIGTAVSRGGSIFSRVAAGAARLGVKGLIGAAVVVAAGWAIWKIYKSVNHNAEAVENKAGPGTQEFISGIASGKHSMGVRSWKAATATGKGRQLQCAWCRANPGRKHPSIRDEEKAWAAHSSGKMPIKIRNIWLDVKANGPFCEDILKRDECTKGAKSTGGGKVSKIATGNLSSEPLEGEITNLESIGIQHNLTGERKRLGELFINKLMEFNINNKYILAGALAVAGKESGFVGKAEGSRYGFERLKAKRAAVARRTARIFLHQIGREPNEEEWRQLSKQNAPKGGIALFNIAYGYDPGPVDGYTSYQEEKAIPHTEEFKVITQDGTINPRLYDPELAGFKYRGRGPIQNTFKENYRRSAKAAGLDVDKIVEDPDLLVRDPAIGVIMSAAVSRLSFKKTTNNMERQISAGNPKDFLEGIKFMAMLAGGGGGNVNRAWFVRATNNAIRAANKHIRILETGMTA